MPFGVSIYRTGCPNFIAFVLKIGLEYVKASFNNNYDKHAVLEPGADPPVPGGAGCFPWSGSGFTGVGFSKEAALELLCFPLPPQPGSVWDLGGQE